MLPYLIFILDLVIAILAALGVEKMLAESSGEKNTKTLVISLVIGAVVFWLMFTFANPVIANMFA